MGKHLGKHWGNKVHLKPFKTPQLPFTQFSKNPLQPPINTNFPAIFKAVPAHPISDSVGTRTEAGESFYLLGFRGFSLFTWGNIWQIHCFVMLISPFNRMTSFSFSSSKSSKSSM